MQRILTFAKKLPWAEIRAQLGRIGLAMQWLSARLPSRYGFWVACMLGVLLALFTLVGFGVGLLALLICLSLVALGVQDVRQTRHAILRNYPVIGHMRFLLEYIRPEIRQYFIESDSEAAPFPGHSARWCTSAPKPSRTTTPLARTWMSGARAMNGSTIPCSRARWNRLTFAFG